MSKTSVGTWTLVVAAVLYPFQNLSLKVAQSRYDLTAVILLGFGGVLFLWRGRIATKAATALWTLIFLQLIVYQQLAIPPLHRLASGLFWFGGLLVILFLGDRIRYNPRLVARVICTTTAVSAVYILLQRFYLDELRPSGWFVEPSYAGLALYSVAAGLLAVLTLTSGGRAWKHVSVMSGIAVLLWAAAVTRSMHLVTFTLVVIGLFSYRYLRPSALFSAKGLVLAPVLGLLVAGAIFGISSVEHFRSRMFVSPSDPNISLMSWLRGFDQMRASIGLSQLLGVGLGGTGEFGFDSGWTGRLAQLGLRDLNLRDAYSLAFRLVIELGPIVAAVLLIFVLGQIRKLHRSFRRGFYRDPHRVFLVFFSLTVMLGALIKEPLYAQSYLYLAIFLFAGESAYSRGRTAQ